MQIRTAVLWSILNKVEHKSLKEDELKIVSLMSLVDKLFPGVEYYSMTGFGQVMQSCVIPILKKRYPELLDAPMEKIKPRAMTKVTKVLPSKGYEWQDSARWQSKFQKILKAA